MDQRYSFYVTRSKLLKQLLDIVKKRTLYTLSLSQGQLTLNSREDCEMSAR